MNLTIKKCMNCKFFIPFFSINKTKIINEGKCAKYSKICMISGDTIYEKASICRRNEFKCGYNSKYFVETKLNGHISFVQSIAYLQYSFLIFGSIPYIYYFYKLKNILFINL